MKSIWDMEARVVSCKTLIQHKILADKSELNWSCSLLGFFGWIRFCSWIAVPFSGTAKDVTSRFALQDSELSCAGLIALAECLANGTRLQRVDLRKNVVQVAGLMALAAALKISKTVTCLDLNCTVSPSCQVRTTRFPVDRTSTTCGWLETGRLLYHELYSPPKERFFRSIFFYWSWKVFSSFQTFRTRSKSILCSPWFNGQLLFECPENVWLTTKNELISGHYFAWMYFYFEISRQVFHAQALISTHLYFSVL